MKTANDNRSEPHVNFDKGLQDEGNKKAFLDTNVSGLSECLLRGQNLDKLIEATRSSAKKQIRLTQTYKRELLRRTTGAAALPESKLERSLWLHWGIHEACTNNPVFLNRTCPHIISYQVPLYNCRPKKQRDGWGKIDVVGIAEDLTPVIIELKAGGSTESILRMVLESVAYGIAIQEAWDPRLRDDWVCALEKLAKKDSSLIKQASLASLPRQLKSCHILCIAPSQYWDPRHKDRRCPKFREILGLLRKKGFDVSFAALNYAIQQLEL